MNWKSCRHRRLRGIAAKMDPFAMIEPTVGMKLTARRERLAMTDPFVTAELAARIKMIVAKNCRR